MLRSFVLSTFVAGVLCTPAFAASEDRGSDADQQACTSDVFRLCSEFVPDAGPIAKCLETKRTQLSPACHQVFFPTKSSHKSRSGA